MNEPERDRRPAPEEPAARPDEPERTVPADYSDAGLVRRRPRPAADAAAQPAIQFALALLLIFLFLLVLWILWPLLSGG